MGKHVSFISYNLLCIMHYEHFYCTSASSDEILLEITPETNRFDLYGDENLLTSIAEALGQRSVLDDVEDPAAGPPHSRRFSDNLCHWHFKHWRISMLSGFLTPHKRP
jgi:hypothetical protein